MNSPLSNIPYSSEASFPLKIPQISSIPSSIIRSIDSIAEKASLSSRITNTFTASVVAAAFQICRAPADLAYIVAKPLDDLIHTGITLAQYKEKKATWSDVVKSFQNLKASSKNVARIALGVAIISGNTFAILWTGSQVSYYNQVMKEAARLSTDAALHAWSTALFKSTCFDILNIFSFYTFIPSSLSSIRLITEGFSSPMHSSYYKSFITQLQIREQIPGVLTKLKRVNIPEAELPANLDECPICYEPLKNNVCQADDNHYFHLPCIVPWLLHHSTCPCCRTSLPVQNSSTSASNSTSSSDSFYHTPTFPNLNNSASPLSNLRSRARLRLRI